MILLSVLLIAGMVSCEDSLGYDPNVEISKITKDTVKDEEPKDPKNVYDIEKVELSFYETFNNTRTNELVRERWPFSVRLSDVKIDTLNRRTFISIKLSCLNQYAQNVKDNRYDWVERFSTLIAGYLDEEIIYLPGQLGTRRSFILDVYSRQHQRLFSFHSSLYNIPPQAMVVSYDQKNGTIHLKIVVDIPRGNYFQTQKFTGDIHIYYVVK